MILNPPDIRLNHMTSSSTFKNAVVIHIGAIMNKKIARQIENNVVIKSDILLDSFPFSLGGIAISADH